MSNKTNKKIVDNESFEIMNYSAFNSEFTSMFIDVTTGALVRVTIDDVESNIEFSKAKETLVSAYQFETGLVKSFNKIYKDIPKAKLITDINLPFGYQVINKYNKDYLFFNYHYNPLNIKEIKPNNANLNPNIMKLFVNLFKSAGGIKYVLNWIKRMVIDGEKNVTALIITGTQGSGKGSFSNLLLRLIGVSNGITVSNNTLTSQFSGELFAKRLAIFNEVSSYHENDLVSAKLKAYTTDDKILINQKGLKPFETPNKMNVIITSNNPQPIKVELSDRRYSVFNSNSKLDGATSSAVNNLSDNDLIQFIGYLKSLRITPEYSPAKPFINEDRLILQKATATKKEYFIDLFQDRANVVKFLNGYLLKSQKKSSHFAPKPYIAKTLSEISEFLYRSRFNDFELYPDTGAIIEAIRDDVNIYIKTGQMPDYLMHILYRVLIDDRVQSRTITKFLETSFKVEQLYISKKNGDDENLNYLSIKDVKTSSAIEFITYYSRAFEESLSEISQLNDNSNQYDVRDEIVNHKFSISEIQSIYYHYNKHLVLNEEHNAFLNIYKFTQNEMRIILNKFKFGTLGNII